MTMRNRSFVIIFCIFFPLVCFSQRITVRVEKRPCHRVDALPGEKLFMEVRTDTGVLVSEADYFLVPFIKLPDSIKLQLVARLLDYRDDTGLCCLRVVDRSFNGIEGCAGHPSGTERYTIQVDAMFMINRLCWPRMMELYSCTPVLYDTVLNRDIDRDGAKLRTVFDSYRKWFKHWIKSGRIGHYFPFNEGRYVWYGGRKPVIARD